MYLRLLKAAPKWAIAIAVFVGSTALFVGWWMLRGSGRPSREVATPSEALVNRDEIRREEIKKKVATLPQKMGWLALVGSDLYDISTGELIFENWLGGAPQRLFYQKETNRLMAQTERGVIRFALDGGKDGVLGDPAAPPAFTHDGKLAIFVRNGDVWIADVDWKEFKLTNERQASRTGQFNPSFFAQNVLMGTEKAILVRNQNQLVSVDLLTGEVEPHQISMNDLARRRSPNGRYLIGDDGKNIYLFDIETRQAKFIPKGRERVNDWQWLSDDRCAFIIGGKNVSYYSVKLGGLSQSTALPFDCNRLAAPSPSGNYVLCFGRAGVIIQDFAKHGCIPFGAPAQDVNWIDDETLILSRDVPDSGMRGTWLKSVRGEERRILDEPYLAGRNDVAAFAIMREVNLVLFATRNALYRMKPDGSELRETAKPAVPLLKIQAVEIWGE